MATCPPVDDGSVDGTDLHDRLFGHRGGDTLRGFGGDDKLFGANGTDVLIGGQGKDTLRGDAPGGREFSDAFIFGQSSGKDIIADFDVNKDVVVIMKGLNGIRKAQDVLDHASQRGKNVIIDLGDGNKITLKNVDLDDLKKNPGDHFDVSNSF